MSIFNEMNYRKGLRQLIGERKKLSKKYTLAAISEVLRVQTPYLSKVFNGHAHFNSDQLWQLCDHLEMGEEETQYLLLCLEYERSVVSSRQKVLARELNEIRERHMDTGEHIETESLVEQLNSQADYYLEPLNLIVHMGMLLKQYKGSTKKLAQAMGRTEEQIKSSLEKLVELGILKIEGEQYENTKKHIHLSKTSSLFKPHQSLLRQLILDHLMRNTGKKEFYNLAITFTGDEKSRDAIQREFLKFLKRADQLIDAAPGENVYQLNFDLFPWLNS